METLASVVNSGIDSKGSSTLSKCYAGGICGQTYGIISNCYNTGTVRGYASNSFSLVAGILSHLPAGVYIVRIGGEKTIKLIKN
ncbi:hypothetical protein FACS189413_00760 [Bacteroidia bacterium]|nr:hypothetical protein FACS189413_00760 [Bacteroidia bacterium]